MSLAATYEDTFNLLCGKLLGEGIHRRVFECRIRPDLVVKVENDEQRHFANVMESKFWGDHQYYDKVAQWLAPVEHLSPDGRVLLQRRVRPISDTDTLPEKLPAFLTDIKRDNFGWLDGKLVCMDYAWTVPNPNTRLRKADW